MSVLDLYAAHECGTPEDEHLGRIARRLLAAVVDRAEQRQPLVADRPVARHGQIDATHEREHVEHRGSGRDVALAQVDLAAPHDGRGVAALEVGRADAPGGTAEYRE